MHYILRISDQTPNTPTTYMDRIIIPSFHSKCVEYNIYCNFNAILAALFISLVIFQLLWSINLCVCYGLRTWMACQNYEVVRLLTLVSTSDRGQTGPRFRVPDAHSSIPTRRISTPMTRDKLYEYNIKRAKDRHTGHQFNQLMVISVTSLVTQETQFFLNRTP